MDGIFQALLMAIAAVGLLGLLMLEPVAVKDQTPSIGIRHGHCVDMGKELPATSCDTKIETLTTSAGFGYPPAY